MSKNVIFLEDHMMVLLAFYNFQRYLANRTTNMTNSGNNNSVVDQNTIKTLKNTCVIAV